MTCGENKNFVGVIVLLLFGRGKISEVMGDFAKGIKSFKKGMSDDDEAPPPAKPGPTEPVKTIEHQTATAAPPANQPVGERKAG